MSKELLFVVDENNQPVEPLPRDEVISRGLWRRTSGGILIHKTTSKVLCQKRSENVDERPGLWIAEFGGKCAPGEDAKVTAIRELQEELGISVGDSDMIFHTLVKSEKRRQFEYQHYVYWGGNESEVIFDPEEVTDITWKSIPELIELLSRSPEWYSYGCEAEMLAKITPTNA